MTFYVHPTEQLVVEIYVRDLQRSKKFYLQLGFDLLSEKKSFVSLMWENHRLFLEERKDLPSPTDFAQANVRIMVADVDECWKRVHEMKARVTKPIADREYGLRDFTVADPDGFGLRFGSWLPRTSE
ncbi:MAG: VOC family protein [Pyrinomonadaceae bacterium]